MSGTLAFLSTILYKPDFPQRRTRPGAVTSGANRGDRRHGRAEKKSVTVATRHASLGRRLETTDLCGRQGFRRIAPPPPRRPQEWNVQRPPSAQAEGGSLIGFLRGFCSRR